MDLAGVVNGTLGVVCAAAVFAMSTGTMLQFFQNSKIKENYHNAGELEYPVFYNGFQRYGGDSGVLTGITGAADTGGCIVCIYQSVVTAYLGAE